MRFVKDSLQPLRSRTFSLIWLGQSVSLFGDQCYAIALVWLITTLSHSPLILSSVWIIAYIPTILFLIIGGAWADRTSPRAIALWADVLRVLVTSVLAILVTLSIITLPMIFVFAAIYGLVGAFFAPALGNLILTIRPPSEYAAINVLQQISREGSALLAPLLAGYLITRYSTGAAFAFDAATFLVSIGSLVLVGAQEIDPVTPQSAYEAERTENSKGVRIGALLAGFRFLWHEQGMFAIVMLFSVTNGLNNVESVLVPLLARVNLHMSAEQFGLMAALWGAGTLIGTLLFSVFGSQVKRRSWAICGSMVILGAAIVAMGFAQAPWQLYGAYGVYGISFTIAELVSSTLWMHLIPETLRGRVFSTISTLAMVLNPFGFLFAGVLGTAYGLRVGIWIGGGAVTILSLGALLSRHVRSLDHLELATGAVGYNK